MLAQMPEFGNYELVGWISRIPPDEIRDIDWYPSLDDFDGEADLLIDFTLPGGTHTAAQWCEQKAVAMLSGTTGLLDEDIQALKSAALQVPVLWAPNLSFGVAVMAALVRQTAAALDASSVVTITDIHHKHKIDAPSGTALSLAMAVEQGRSEWQHGEPGDVAFSSVREGDIVGEHTVSFVSGDEVIEITHKALDGKVFARGALKAGEWLLEQGPGYYSSGDWS